jgi:hypothetical protein
MRFKRFRLITVISLLLFSSFALLIAFFAYQLHLDNNIVMGNSRKLLAFLGFCSLGMAFWLAFSESILAYRFLRRISGYLNQLSTWLANSTIGRWFSSAMGRYRRTPFFFWCNQNSWIWVITAVVFVIFVYFWFITGAKWTWTPYSSYFDMLANAFIKGSLAILEKPPTALANLANPYDYNNREGINYIWDITYFKGNYYLYWGAVPALLAALAKWIHPAIVEDQQLVFFFLSGLAIVIAAIFHWLRTRFFPRASAWTAGLFVITAMLCLPMLWIINRAMVYEAAIAGGQFFLLLGLYAAVRSMDSSHKPAWLFLAGLAWGAAVNSRVNYALAVFWFVLAISLFLFIRLRKPSTWLLTLLFLFLPLIFWASGFSWYNFARFGSILETGHRYQLTGVARPEDYGLVTSVLNVIPNLYNYLARPFASLGYRFPFIDVPYITDDMWPWFIPKPPGVYAAKQISGIFLTIPIIWMVFLPSIKLFEKIWFWAKEKPAPKQSVHPDLKWVCWMVLGSVIILLASIAIFIAANMRYLVDIIPMLFILISLGVWYTLDFLEKSPAWRRVLLIVVLILGLVSISIGVLVGFGVPPYRFENINPSLYETISRFLTGK